MAGGDKNGAVQPKFCPARKKRSIYGANLYVTVLLLHPKKRRAFSSPLSVELRILTIFMERISCNESRASRMPASEIV